MAESSSGADNSSWWDGWIQSAKEKSSQALELIKADLNEFKNVCTHDASAAVSSTAQRVQNSLQVDDDNSTSAQVKQGFSSLLGGITKVLTVPPDDDTEDDVLRVTSTGNLEVFDKAKVRLYEIQTSPQTFCTDPDGPTDEFEEWKTTFDLESKKGDISELLVSVSEMRGIYTKLVPSAVSHSNFWERYFYKVHQLECDEKRRMAHKMRADKLKADGSSAAQSWDDDWEVENPSPPLTPPRPQTEHLSGEPESAGDEGKAPMSTSTAAGNDAEVTEDDPELLQSDTAEAELVSQVNPSGPEGVEPEDVKLAVIADSPVSFQKSEDSLSATDAAQATGNEASLSSAAATSPEGIPKESLCEDHVSTSQQPDSHTTGSSSPKPPGQPDDEILVKEKGGYVMLGSERPTPTSSIGSSHTKDTDSKLADDWDEELFGDDLKAVQELAQHMTVSSKDDQKDDDDWEDWE